MRSIFWFRRDLRLEDNKALFEAFKNSDEVIPIFIFNKSLIKELNTLNKKLGLIVDALKHISKEMPIYTFYEEDEDVFELLIEKFKPDAVYTTKAFSWQGEKRDKRIKDLLERKSIKFVEVFDNYLVDFRDIPYTKVFTPFYKKWRSLIKEEKVSLDEDVIRGKVLKLDLDNIEKLIFKYKELDLKHPHWSYEDCVKRLNSFKFEEYEEKRNYPFLDGSSKLSPCIRFGILSIRDIYQKAKNKSETFVSELSWREFWYHIKHYFYDFKSLEFQEKRRGIAWENDDKKIEKFMKGETGYPIIDAGIMQLKEENWVHNRVRMILASFLVKDLMVDWRIGESFFKEYLIDYDEVVNVGNWQWSSSVGPDPKPLRIFNPILQSQKFDKDCIYIKKYLKELKNEDCEKLHDPISYKLNYHNPVVNHYEASKKAKELFSKKY
ncbi:MAG: cryptochrome/photolyase family protein, partial [Hydrogenobaculum sp.]